MGCQVARPFSQTNRSRAASVQPSDVTFPREGVCNGAGSSHFSAAPRRCGPSPRARSRVNRFAHRRAHDPGRGGSRRADPSVSRHSCRDCSNLDGPSAVTCGWKPAWAAGDAGRINKYAVELVALVTRCYPRHWRGDFRGRYYRRAASCRLCLWPSLIRLALASSTVCRGRAATPLASCSLEYSTSAKWVELLKHIAPSVTRGSHS